MRADKLIGCIPRKYGIIILGVSPWWNLVVHGMNLSPFETIFCITTGFAYLLIVCSDSAQNRRIFFFTQLIYQIGLVNASNIFEAYSSPEIVDLSLSDYICFEFI